MSSEVGVDALGLDRHHTASLSAAGVLGNFNMQSERLPIDCFQLSGLRGLQRVIRESFAADAPESRGASWRRD